MPLAALGAALLGVGASGATRVLGAQGFALRPELRADAVLGDRPIALGGIGLAQDAGAYARGALLVSGGMARSAGVWRPAGEVALVGRFLLDPLRQARTGVYVGGGVAARLVRDAAPAWLLVATAGVEGRPRRGWAPALEAGVGGGVRLALVLRRSRADRR